MDIKHLQYFIEVSNFNSFSRAADHLFITQPTISKMIKNLETELGVELFDRSRKKLALTDAGQIILEQAKLIDNAFNNLETELDNLAGLKKGHIRIGLPPIFDAVFLKIVSSFHEKYPGITFQLVEDGSKKIEEDVGNNLLDVGIIVLPTKNDIFDHVFGRGGITLCIPCKMSCKLQCKSPWKFILEKIPWNTKKTLSLYSEPIIIKMVTPQSPPIVEDRSKYVCCIDIAEKPPYNPRQRLTSLYYTLTNSRFITSVLSDSSAAPLRKATAFAAANPSLAFYSTRLSRYPSSTRRVSSSFRIIRAHRARSTGGHLAPAE